MFALQSDFDGHILSLGFTLVNLVSRLQHHDSKTPEVPTQLLWWQLSQCVCVCVCVLTKITDMAQRAIAHIHSHTHGLCAQRVQTWSLSQGKHQCVVLSSHSDKHNQTVCSNINIHTLWRRGEGFSPLSLSLSNSRSLWVWEGFWRWVRERGLVGCGWTFTRDSTQRNLLVPQCDGAPLVWKQWTAGRSKLEELQWNCVQLSMSLPEQKKTSIFLPKSCPRNSWMSTFSGTSSGN